MSKPPEQSPGPARIIVIHGDEDFLRRRVLAETIETVLGEDRDQMALAEFDGEEAELSAVLDECRTPSLLAPVRMVCVLNADPFITEHRAALEKYSASPSESGVLVLVCSKWMKTWRLYKLVEKIGRSVTCDGPKYRNDFVAWAIGHARAAYASQLDRPAAERLVELVGDSLGMLDMELAKLATFVAPRRRIETADVEGLVGASRVEKVFGITDAIGRRDAKSALGLWEQVLASDRDAPYKAVGGLAYGFRRLAETKRLAEQGTPLQEAIKRIGLFGEPSMLRRQLERFTLAGWQDWLMKLLKIDVGAKSGGPDVETAVERLIVSMCSAGA